MTRARRLALLIATATVAAAAALPAGPLAVLRGHAAAAHPSLLFSAADVPAMQQRILSGVDAQAWTQLKAKVDAYTDPSNPSYVNPALVGSPDAALLPNAHGYDGLLGQNQMASYLIDLSFAYVLNGDTRYGNAAVNLLLAEVSAHWPAWGDGGGQPGLGRGDLLRGAGLAFDWTYNLMTPAQRLTIVQSLTDPSSSILCGSDVSPTSCDGAAGNPGSNHSSVGAGGTGIALMAINGEPGVNNPTDLSARLTRTRDRVLATMQDSYGANGDGHEGVNYTSYGLHAQIPFAMAWKRTQNEDLLALAPNLSRVPVWLSYEQLPGRGLDFVPRNDSDTRNEPLQEVLPTLFAVRNDGLTGWLYDHTMGPQGEDTFNTAVPYVADTNTGAHDCAPPTSGDPSGNLFCGWYSAEVFTILYYQSPQQVARVDPSTVTPLSQHFPDFGLAVMRTGWSNGANDVLLTFEAKRNEQHLSHYEYDIGNFTVYGYGGNFALDSGYGRNNSCTSTTTLYQGGGGPCYETEAGTPVGHNVVLVGDSAAAPALAADRTQLNADFASTNETIPEFVNAANMSFLRSDLRSAYSSTVASVPLAGRDVFFGRAPGEPVVVAVTDTLQPHPGADSYRWQMHTDGANSVAILGGGVRIQSPSGAVMAGQITDAAGTPQVTPTLFDESLYEPFESPLTHTVLTSQTPSTGTTAEMDHLAAFGIAPPGTVNELVSAVPMAWGGSVVQLTYNGRVILVASRAATSTSVTGPLTTDAAFAKLSAGYGETMLDQGTSLVSGGITYVQVTGGAATVAVSGSGITATGPVGATYSVYAPQAISSVVVNGTAVNSCRTGNQLSFPC